MCGITGIVGPMRERAAVLAAMTRAIAHRGPDGEGAWSDEACALGHRRLSIIDLSSNAAQPMANEDGSIQVTFNGEIYGFGALRGELVAKGHTFRSHSDTEVVVHLYEEEGDRAFARLNGMFAVAVWDARRRRLVLARDRFGQKPLFWAEAGGALVFASELKSLFEVPGLAFAPSLPAIDAYLTTHFVAAPGTFFEGLHRLPAGHVLVKELGRAPVVAPFEARAVRRRAWVRFDDAVDEALALVKASVARQLVADVPVGLFLSGGIDSTLVLAALADLGRAGIPAFTASFADSAKHDELPFARVAADRFGGSLREVPIDARAFLDLDRLVAMYDEPFADVAALPTHLLAKAARAEVTVALTGDGGDELFGGYTHHRVALWLGRLGAPSFARRALLGGAAAALAGHGARRGKL
ncbi:MAG TPA: asparagine synthase (glutamine-hydrolyzing), partial [Byssovorax sp.]